MIRYRVFPFSERGVLKSKKIRTIKRYYEFEEEICFRSVYDEDIWFEAERWAIHLFTSPKQGESPEGVRALEIYRDWLQGHNVPVSLVYYEVRERYAFQYVILPDTPMDKLLFDLSVIRFMTSEEFTLGKLITGDTIVDIFWELKLLSGNGYNIHPAHYPSTSFYAIIGGSLYQRDKPKPSKNELIFATHWYINAVYKHHEWGDTLVMDAVEGGYSRLHELRSTGLSAHFFLEHYERDEPEISRLIAQYERNNNND